jgi:hypothetical protein
MANDGFNGSIVTFPTTSASIGSLRGIAFDETSAEVDVTGSTHTIRKYVAGIPKHSVSLDIVGASTALAIGTTGALEVVWNDTKTVGTLAKAVIVGNSCKGQLDGEILSTIKFAQTK